MRTENELKKINWMKMMRSVCAVQNHRMKMNIEIKGKTNDFNWKTEMQIFRWFFIFQQLFFHLFIFFHSSLEWVVILLGFWFHCMFEHWINMDFSYSIPIPLIYKRQNAFISEIELSSFYTRFHCITASFQFYFTSR